EPAKDIRLNPVANPGILRIGIPVGRRTHQKPIWVLAKGPVDARVCDPDSFYCDYIGNAGLFTQHRLGKKHRVQKPLHVAWSRQSLFKTLDEARADFSRIIVSQLAR